MIRSSFSQTNMFSHYPRQWYFKYVLKIKEVSDFSYANGGTAVHKTVEQLLLKNITEIEALKEFFNNQWDSFNLSSSIIKHMKDKYWLMVLNARERNIECTDIESEINFPDVRMFLDILNKNTWEIRDLKTSKRDDKHDKEYTDQTLLYAWGILRQYNVLPRKLTVDYLQYSGSKGILEIVPTQQDIDRISKWYNDCGSEMEALSNLKICPAKCKECNPWCSFTKECAAEENEFTVKLNIWNSLIFINCEFNDIINKQLHKKFSYVQTKDAYMNKKWNKQNPTIDFYNETKHSLPLGFKTQLIKTFTDYCEWKKCKLNLIINDTRQFNEAKIIMPEKFLNGNELRYYQKDAVKVVLDNKIVSIQSATGSGKTEMSIDVIRQLGYKTLFIVDRKELMKQTIERIEKCLGVEVGKLGEGERDLKHITVGMIQTINSNINNNDQEIIDYLKTIRFTIFDEAHKCAADSFITLNKCLNNSEYKLLMSGTLRRNDGEDMKLYSIGGEIKYTKQAKELINEDILMNPKVYFIKDYMTREQEHEIRLSCSTGLINAEDQYPIFYDKFIVTNSLRNELIKQVVDVVSKNNKKVLILVKLIEHGKILEQLIPNSKYLYGETPKKEREEIFNDFSHGNLNVMISMVTMMSEGLDWPSLELFLMASGIKTDNKIIQGIGRILRKCKNKEQPKYIDFMDYGGMIRNASVCRRRALRREGYYINEVTLDEFIETQTI